MVSLSTIRTDSYAAVRTLVNTNKISGSVVVNSYPEQTPSFPCYVMPMPDVSAPDPITTTGDKREYRIAYEFTLFATIESGQGQAKVAAMLDNLQNTFESNSLSNHYFVSLSPSAIERVDVNSTKLYAAGCVVTFAFFP